jgi:hypothetical protein
LSGQLIDVGEHGLANRTEAGKPGYARRRTGTVSCTPPMRSNSLR